MLWYIGNISSIFFHVSYEEIFKYLLSKRIGVYYAATIFNILETLVYYFIHKEKAVAPKVYRIVLHYWLAYLSTKSLAYSLLWHTFNNVVADFFQSLVKPGMLVNSACFAERRYKLVLTQLGHTVAERQTGRSDVHGCKETFGARRMYGVRDFYADVNRSCIHNERVSLDGRVFKKLPMHDNEVAVYIKWQGERVFLREYCGVEKVVEPMDFYDFVSTFPPAKRLRLIEIYEHGSPNTDKHASSFIKQELVLRESDDTVHKDPRMIQGCPEDMTVQCGPYLRLLVKHLKSKVTPDVICSDSFRKRQHFFYSCGMNSTDVGRVYEECLEFMASVCPAGERVIVIEDDQSRFDEHIGRGAFSYLEQFYSMYLPGPVSMRLSRGTSRGYTNLGTRYTVPYTMQSGWPDTSFGDTLLNMAMKMRIHGPGGKWFSIVCGDDSLTITTTDTLRAMGGAGNIARQYSEFGMEVDIVIRDDPMTAEFCSSRFFPHKEGLVLFPKSGKILGRLGWDRIDRQPKQQLMWLRGICNTLAQYAIIDPISRSLHDRLMQKLGCGGVIAHHVLDEQYVYVPDYEGLSIDLDAVQEYYFLHYDLLPSDIDSLCSQIANHLEIGGEITHPAAQQMCKVDCS